MAPQRVHQLAVLHQVGLPQSRVVGAPDGRVAGPFLDQQLRSLAPPVDLRATGRMGNASTQRHTGSKTRLCSGTWKTVNKKPSCVMGKGLTSCDSSLY